MRRRFVVPLLVVALGLASSACGGGAGDDDGAASGSGATATSGAAQAQQQQSSGTGYPACPITVEQVSAVTGEPMQVEDGICQFTPASGKLNPNILFVKQSGVLDSAEVREETGLVTKVDGIGDEAYASGEMVTGTRVAVRDGKQWFEVEVDILSDPVRELDWAKQIAKLIADNN